MRCHEDVNAAGRSAAKTRTDRRLTLLGVAVAGAAAVLVAGASAAGAAKAREWNAVALPPVQPKEFRGDVRSLKPVPVEKRGDFELHLRKSRKVPFGPVQAGPATPSTSSMPGAIQNFAGLGFAGLCGSELCGAGWPPDPVGDVGPSHYVEAVNTSIGIFGKTGALLAAFTFNSLWSGGGTGTPCDTGNFGDVTVIYDHLSDHWIVADLGFQLDATLTTPVPPFYECIAVSKTGDPVNGGWYLYAVRVDPGTPGAPPAGYLNDYPKMGLWPDGLYMTANEFDLNLPTQPFKGVALWAFDRVAMEAGQPLKQLVVFIDDASDPVSALPANLRGVLPPPGTPEYVVSESATSYDFEVRTFTVDWTSPANGVVSAPTNVAHSQYVVGAGDIVPQPADPFGGTGALDMIDDRPMMQAQYRNLGGAESLWLAHTVRTSTSSPTGLQWAQLDVTGKTVATSPVQQQIFTNGDDGLWRFMPSLAVDRAGNMAIGYSVSSSALYPSIRYAGRLVTDPLNTLPQAEATLQAGLGSQTVSPRWGDYSAMTVDPTDDCTLWYVNEYYATPYDGSLLFAQWSTRIGSFTFPGCVGGPTTGTLQGTVTDSSTNATLTGATVALSTGGSTTTDASGFYQLTNVTPGTYDVTAAKPGYTTSTANGVLVTAGSTTTQDFALAAPAPTITGFSPKQGKVGTTVRINGTNFITARSVVFNTTAATFTVSSGTQILTTVPPGATTGRIAVTTSGGTATSLQSFKVR